MNMRTALKKIPRLLRIESTDHGREMSLDEFMSADYEGGYQYELIDGRLYVSPLPNQPQNVVELWIFAKLFLYALQNPTIINHVSNKARVFVPGGKVTNPEPDVACYHDYPKHLPFETISWEDISPILVIEVLSEYDSDKDLIRNPKLYWKVPSIQEYWIFDTRKSAAEPTLLVYRRQGRSWKKQRISFGGLYSTDLLPGFALVVNPRV